eukprot:510191-Rhodomonas_salina.3
MAARGGLSSISTLGLSGFKSGLLGSAREEDGDLTLPNPTASSSSLRDRADAPSQLCAPAGERPGRLSLTLSWSESERGPPKSGCSPSEPRADSICCFSLGVCFCCFAGSRSSCTTPMAPLTWGVALPVSAAAPDTPSPDGPLVTVTALSSP